MQVEKADILIQNETTADVWKSYLYWALWVGATFFGIYPLCNWIASKQDVFYKIYFEAELAIPFWPQFIWVYLSLFILFFMPPFFLNTEQLATLGKRLIAGTLLSGLIFLIFPTELGFERIEPEGIYGPLFAWIFAIDLPHNMVPSLHIVFSGLILYSIFKASKKPFISMMALVWIVGIFLSTLFVNQHHITDGVSAVVLNYFLVKFFKE